MIIKSLETGMLAANCYLVACEETREAVIIDPGGSAGDIKEKIEQLDLQVKAIINTHGHYDHIGANGQMKELTGAPIMLHEKDLKVYKNPAGKGLSLFVKNAPPPDEYIREGDVITFGEQELKVMETPGHTPGGISLLAKNQQTAVFTGDTLFNLSIGRTDLAGGSFEEIIDSIKKKILPLPDSAAVYPGHGPASTVGQERARNPFLTG